MAQNKLESNEVDGSDSIATSRGGILLEKEPKTCEGTVELFTNSKTLDLLFRWALFPVWSRLLIPLTYARVVVLAMRVAGIRSGGALGKIRDTNYWDDPPKPSRFPSATRMKSIYRRKRYMPRASFLSNTSCHEEIKKTGSLGRREKVWYWMNR